MNRHASPSQGEPVIWQLQRRPLPSLSERIGRASKRFVYLTLCGLVLGGMVHIATILMVPWLARSDAVSRFAETGADGKAERIMVAPGEPAIVDLDPATVIASCGYDLTEGPLRVVARAGTAPLALSIHPRGGGVSYAITDRAAIRGNLEIVILTPAQLADRIGRDDDGSTSRELRVTLARPQGIVLARALARRPSDRAEAEALVGDVSCGAAD
ncbi:MAG: DUF1254 domain-containing protein [Bosea sp. (in: a-proteobacteria)]